MRKRTAPFLVDLGRRRNSMLRKPHLKAPGHIHNAISYFFPPRAENSARLFNVKGPCLEFARSDPGLQTRKR